jgi:hypothetical protein
MEPGEKADRLNVRFRSEGAKQSRTIGWMGGQASSGRAALLNPIGALSTRLWHYNWGSFL